MTTSNGNLGSVAARAAGTVVRGVRSAVDHSGARDTGAGQPASGWLVVTVYCEPSEIDLAALPAPLAELGDRVEVRVQAAPDGRGAELAARLRDRPSSGSAFDRLRGADPQAEVRSALRKAKQLIEVGEVLAVDPTPHGERTATPGGLLLERWTKVAPEAGVR